MMQRNSPDILKRSVVLGSVLLTLALCGASSLPHPDAVFASQNFPALTQPYHGDGQTKDQFQEEVFPFRPNAPSTHNLVISVDKDGNYTDATWQDVKGVKHTLNELRTKNQIPSGQLFWDNVLQTMVVGKQKIDDTGEPVAYSPNDPYPNPRTIKLTQNPFSGRWEAQYIVLDKSQPILRLDFATGQFVPN